MMVILGELFKAISLEAIFNIFIEQSDELSAARWVNSEEPTKMRRIALEENIEELGPEYWKVFWQ